MLFKRYAVMAIFLATMPAHAQWSQQVYSGEYESCVPACEKSNPGGHDRCAAYCRCVMDGLQKQFPDYAELVREMTQQKDLSRMQSIANICNQTLFGVPAKKLQSK
jgi:hypothetical protein